ncbi:hypothetical protein PVAP13_3KG416827 [Panicum virgatum]|uniref:Uncharacterized protein n=1 Tax=Panicum virgatum TaxID=38727 RepID=A0A8T0V5P9_PANVG|nr:hypothetical protein PVAP13_3KG416827 [Panicum virgatum]
MDSSFSSPLHWSSMSPLPEERTPLLHPPWHCARQRTPPAVHRHTGVAAVHPQGPHATASPAQHIPAICGRPWPRTRGRGGIHGRRNTGGAPRSDGGSPRPRRKARRTAPLRVDAQEAAAHAHRGIRGAQQGLTDAQEAAAHPHRRLRRTAQAAVALRAGAPEQRRSSAAAQDVDDAGKARQRRRKPAAARPTGAGGGGGPCPEGWRRQRKGSGGIAR